MIVVIPKRSIASQFIQRIFIDKKYQFQLFNSVIVASAIKGDCDILYSEDMQHKLLVNNTLPVINPLVH
jgi:predicted nucleic acid-binding protein